MKRTSHLIAAGATSVALLGGIGAGIAYADPTPAPSATTTAAPEPGATTSGPAKKDRVLHAELFFQRGKVTAVSAGSITIWSADAYVGTYVVTEKTRVVVGRKADRLQGTIADVATGDRVSVLAAKDGDTLTAKRIVEPGPK